MKAEDNMKAEDLVLFILSHNSPDKCETLDLFKSVNFKGKIYIIIDDGDKFVDRYKERYGDSLVIFSKGDYLDSIDLGGSLSNLKSLSVPTFVRNAVEDKARQMGYDHCIVADDDIRRFVFRPVINDMDKVPYIEVTDINEPLLEYYNFMKDCDIAAVGMGAGNMYIGGKKGILSGTFIKRRFVTNMYMRNLSHDIKWSLPNDDLGTCIRYGAQGELLLSLPYVQIICRPQYTQPGGGNKQNGMEDYYKSTDLFNMFYPNLMAEPSFCKVQKYGDGYRTRLSLENAFPKIVDEKYKI